MSSDEGVPGDREVPGLMGHLTDLRLELSSCEVRLVLVSDSEREAQSLTDALARQLRRGRLDISLQIPPEDAEGIVGARERERPN